MNFKPSPDYCAKREAKDDARIFVKPCKTDPPNVRLTDHSWPFLVSIALHTLFFAILCIPALQYPASIRADSLNVFWLSFDMLSDAPAVPKESSYIEQRMDKQTALANQLNEVMPTVVTNHTAPVPLANEAHITSLDERSDAVLISAGNRPAKIETAIVKSDSERPEPIRTELQSLQVAADKAPSPVRSGPQPVATTLKSLAVPLEPEPTPKQSTLQTLPPVQLSQQSSGENAAPDQRSDKRKDTVKSIAQTKNNQQQSVVMTKKEFVRPVKADHQQSASVTLNDDKLKSVETIATNVKQPVKMKAPLVETGSKSKQTETRLVTPKEPSLPIVRGDVKLVVTGSTQIITSISFKEFALSRRDRPFSRTESKKEKAVEPKIVSSGETTEVVIEQTRPGVYTFSVEPVIGEVQVDFSMKLYDGTSRKIIKQLGKKALSHKSVLCRLLMPEGILWEEDREFSGNMEDAESITKFITSTGLMWKEYNN